MTPERNAPEHITSVSTYVIVYVGLLALTLATSLVAFVDLGPWSMVIALAFAAAKALLVILFFMDVLHNHRFNPALFVVGIIWMLLLIALTLADYATRGWIPFPGK